MSRRIELGAVPRGLAPHTPPSHVGRGDGPRARTPEVAPAEVDAADAPGSSAGESEGRGGASGSSRSGRGQAAWATDRSAPVAPGTPGAPTTQTADRTKAPEREAPRDGYGGDGPPGEAQGRLGDGKRVPVRNMKLLTPQLERFLGQGTAQLAQRFKMDLGLLRPQVMPPELSGKDQAQRLWSFFGAYAEAAAAAPFSKEGLEAFRQALQDAGFLRFKDAKSGEDGVQRAMWTLESPGPEEARARLDAVDLVPAREEETLLPEGFFTVAKEAKAEKQQAARVAALAASPETEAARAAAETAPDAVLAQVPGQEAQRVNLLAAQAAAAAIAQDGRGDPLEGGGRREGRRSGILGHNMLFNTLHLFRQEGPDSAVEKAKWDRIAFGAVLALVGITLAALALISL